jgi:peptide-methionine (S)-S-oxide reductase
MSRLAKTILPAILACFSLGVVSIAAGAEDTVRLPAPMVDEAVPASGGLETAVLAGGCFWGVQKVFQHVKGVQEAVSGYAGGSKASADYDTVSSGSTGHAESVRVTFDPRVVSYGTILQIFFSVAHDPTQRDRQGPDVGTQYRSDIFATSTEQARVATAYVRQLDAARIFGHAIATRIDTLTGFFPAEDYHQNYATLHPESAYIAYNDLPKVHALERLYPERFRAEPVLVSVATHRRSVQ